MNPEIHSVTISVKTTTRIAVPIDSSDVRVLPIDLPTTLRLVDANNPTIALARERINEAFNQWLEQARKHYRVEYRQEAFQ